MSVLAESFCDAASIQHLIGSRSGLHKEGDTAPPTPRVGVGS